MDSLISAVSSLVNGFHNFFQARAVKKAEKKSVLEEKKVPVPAGPDDYRMYKFGCWLCSGMTKFKCKPSTKQRHYVVECKMCGMENKVKVDAELTNTK
jgi:transcription elongation factor Elf1